MGESNQFYADNENADGVDVSTIDLSIAYEIKDKSIPEDEFESTPVGFFCRDCRKLVETKKSEKGLRFTCSECGGKNIAFGTTRALTNHFHLNDAGVQKD